MAGQEDYYDAEIAPLLLQAAKLAQDAGLPLVATVEYAPGDFGTTATLPADHSHAMAMNLMAARAKGNIDALALGMAKRVHQMGCGHGSIVLMQLGEPTQPSAAAPSSSAEGE